MLGVGARVGARSLNLHAFVAIRNMISTHQPQSADLGFVSQAVIQPQLVGIKPQITAASVWQLCGRPVVVAFFFFSMMDKYWVMGWPVCWGGLRRLNNFKVRFFGPQVVVCIRRNMWEMEL